ncbi:hypothetical protein GCM10009740_13000 [Terrabacter terrae]|uniref:Uncharacterized protein n=1 Tax=Terrabacter terrae TaxID=318434 RepID=A0ABN2TYY3_9MICO
MSRLDEAAHPAVTMPAELALPLPTGDPHSLHLSATTLERAFARATSTTTVRGTLSGRLDAVWAGEAAAAARAEADELGRRSRRVVGALSPTARSLRTYAAALESAIARVRSLQRQWDALDAERALASLRAAALPDPTGTVCALAVEHARVEQALGRARLSRAHERVLDELRASARRCAHVIAGVTEETVPGSASCTPAQVRRAVTGGLWFADGVVSARESRDAALSDSVLVRRAVAASATSHASVPDAAVALLAARLQERADDAVYAQALLSELGADGLARLLMAAGVAQSRSGAHVDTVRGLLAGMGSLVLTATSHSAPTGTDPRTRRQLASAAAFLADDLVDAIGTVHDGPGDGRATGAWLLGQLLSGARAAGDDRRLPPALARRAAAAAATAEVAETRDADVRLRGGTTLDAGGDATFASWFDDASRSGDALHILLEQVGEDPSEHAALLAEPLPDSVVAGGALANSRGDPLTFGEHLVRRWVTVEAGSIASHPDLRLATDADLVRFLPSISSQTTAGAAETRTRLMLELSRTSAHAMLDASTTRIYTRATAPIEADVADWLSAMRENVDRAVAAPVADPGAPRPYAARASCGMQPWLDGAELTGVVGALAVDTGMGRRAKDPGAAFVRLVDNELAAAKASARSGGDVRSDVARLGFLDQSASSALVAVARRQDELNRSALEGVAEATHVVLAIRSGDKDELWSMVQAYAHGGTARGAADDLAIALVRSNVELAQTERNDLRRAGLLASLTTITGGGTEMRSPLLAGAGRGPALPSADDLAKARRAEVDAAWAALRNEKVQTFTESLTGALQNRSQAPDRLPAVGGPHADVNTALAGLSRGQQRHVRVVRSEKELRVLLAHVTESARPETPPGNYHGRTWQRDDGLRIGERTSTRFGPSIDIWFPNGEYKKVHIDAVAKS